MLTTVVASVALGKMLRTISKFQLKTVWVNTNRNTTSQFYYSSQHSSAKQRKYHVTGEKFSIRIFKICTPCQYYSHKQIKEDEKCTAWGTYDGEARYIRGFGGEN